MNRIIKEKLQQLEDQWLNGNIGTYEFYVLKNRLLESELKTNLGE